jgi:diguanylate cyclase (GGDEF)-like protein
VRSGIDRGETSPSSRRRSTSTRCCRGRSLPLAHDSVLAEAAERVRSVVRSADIACRVGGDEFAVILPESSLADADQLYRRVQQAVTARPLGHVGKLNLSAGVAELTAEDDAVTFFQRADDAMYRAKAAGKGCVVAANA